MNIARKYTAKNIELENLVLDKENPRFAELYNGSDKQNDIIEYLLYTESASEIATAIAKEGEFYEDRPLWVLRQNNKYIVKDGNRRCAAVKALQLPNKYDLQVPKFEIKRLPVLEYMNHTDLEKRVRLEHNSNLVRPWGRIAKALEIYRLFSSGNSIEFLTVIDSKPKPLIKLATFYYAAVAIKGAEFRQLVRKERGEASGKTIIFERLFGLRGECGYSFKSKTSEISIKDNTMFTAYINAIVSYLLANPKTTSREIDKEGADIFLRKLAKYGFSPNKSTVIEKQSAKGQASQGTDGFRENQQKKARNRQSIQKNPNLKRKEIPATLKALINECYNLGHNNFANAKIALTRVTLECTLKYVIENTKKSDGKFLSSAGWFNQAMRDSSSNPLPYIKFDVLKNKFTELIIDKSINKAFHTFDIQKTQQIIHNYKVAALPHDAKSLCDNLVHLLEFMLQEETELIKSLDQDRLL